MRNKVACYQGSTLTDFRWPVTSDNYWPLVLLLQSLVYTVSGGCNFFVAPRASISSDLLALGDFHWPPADGPVLVSIPDVMIYCYSHFIQGKGVGYRCAIGTSSNKLKNCKENSAIIPLHLYTFSSF